MSEGQQTTGADFPLWGLGAALAAIIVIAVWEGPWPSPCQPQQQTAANQTEASAADKKAAVASQPSASRAQYQCDEKDSDWWMVRLTALIGAIGFIQFVMFYRQWSVMREGLGDTKTAAEAALANAQAAHRMADAAIGAETARVRPVQIVLEPPTYFGPPPFGFAEIPRNESIETIIRHGSVTVRFKNSGRTEADVTAVSVNRAVGKLPKVPTYRRPQVFSPTQSIPVGESKWDHRDFWYGHPALSDEQASEIVAGRESFWVYGFLEFYDFLGNRQTVKFCGRLMGGGLAGPVTNPNLWLTGPATYLMGDVPVRNYLTEIRGT